MSDVSREEFDALSTQVTEIQRRLSQTSTEIGGLGRRLEALADAVAAIDVRLALVRAEIRVNNGTVTDYTRQVSRKLDAILAHLGIDLP